MCRQDFFLSCRWGAYLTLADRVLELWSSQIQCQMRLSHAGSMSASTLSRVIHALLECSRKDRNKVYPNAIYWEMNAIGLVFNEDSILIQSRCWWKSLVSGTRFASSWKLAFAVIRTGPPDLLLRSSYLLSTFYVLVEVAGLNTCHCCYSTCLTLKRQQA